jgi:glycosyltransferase involved in cell wall biosynthesis
MSVMSTHEIELLQKSELFDKDWYSATYPDVALSHLSPQEHYLRVGALLGRDPGPAFSTTCYLADFPDVAIAGLNPLVHYIQSGRTEGRVIRLAGEQPAAAPVEPLLGSSTPPTSSIYPGHVPRRSGRQLLLVVGHLAGAAIFGAERSLLGLLEAIDAIGMDAVVALPSDENHEYLEAVRARSSAVHITAVPTRRARRQPQAEVVRDYVRLIQDTGAAAVHVNTIVPREPLVAARQVGVPAVVHAREIPGGDTDLEKWLDASAEEIVASVLDDADYVIATSRAVADAYPLSGRTAVVGNTVDPALFDLPSDPHTDLVRVVLVGSVHPKKGVREFTQLARLLGSRTNASFVVIGPLTPWAHQLAAEGISPNIEFAGPASDPVEAMNAADIVVNLSTVSEGFGRTALEAMTAGRPAVVFARGGLTELIRDGVCGYVVPAGDLTLFAHRVGRLIDDPELRRTMGEAGRRIARERFSLESAVKDLATAYRAILPDESTLRQRAGDVFVPLPMENRSEFDRPFYIQNRGRFAFSTAVEFVTSDQFVCASLLGRELHLVHFDEGARTGHITCSIRTTDGARDVSVDLFDHDGDGRLVTANCEDSTLSTYRLGAGIIEFVDVVRLVGDDQGYCHGAAFVPDRPGVVCAATITGSSAAIFLASAGARRLGSFAKPGWVVKDVAFSGPGNLEMIAALMSEPVGRDAHSEHDSELVLVSTDDDLTGFSIIDGIDLPGLTVDGCCIYGCLVFVACQSDDAILVFELSEGRLTRLPDLLGFSFPHDVAVSPDGTWIAAANYGSNDVQLRPMPDHLLGHIRRRRT